MSGSWFPQRRQGLSARQRPSGLLKNIPGRRENGKDLRVSSLAGGMATKTESEDERWLARPPDDSSDSEEDRHRTADMVPTNFKKNEKTELPSSGHVSTDVPYEPEVPQEGVQARSVGSKRTADNISGSHLTDKTGFTKRKKVAKTFGKAAQQSARDTKKTSSSQDRSPAKPKFKTHEAIDSPSPTSVKHTNKAVPRQHSVLSSPSNSPAKQKFHKRVILDDSPVKPRKAFVKPGLGSDEESPPAQRSTGRTRGSKSQIKKGKLSSQEDDEPSEKSSLQKFKKHFLDDLDDLKDVPDDPSRPILSTQQVNHLLGPADAGLNSDSDLSSLDDDMFPKEPRCPMCHELVDPELLRQHTSHGRMNIKQQTSFCRLHKRKEAEVAQTNKGYPKIDWDTLESRMQRHEEPIKDILEGRKASHFADKLKGHVEAGENRTLLRSDDDLIPGYYGPRGLRVMADFIVRTFSDILRKRAVEDRLVSSRGYTGYVQAVLVQELALRLIMEDMSVSEEVAREIMLESSNVGELMHEETRDVVLRSDNEED